MSKYITFNDTSIKFKKNVIIKRFILKKIPYTYSDLVSSLIYKYHSKLKLIGVNLPNLIKYKDLEFKFEYCGESLIDVLKEKDLTIKNIDNIIDQITIILRKCVDRKVSLDPHIKNFTLKNGVVYYVDTFPPVFNEYLNILIQYNPENKKNIIKHIKTWSPNRIMYHFLADLKKTKNLNKKIYLRSKKKFIQKGYIKRFSIDKVNEIIRIEGDNLKCKSFTLS